MRSACLWVFFIGTKQQDGVCVCVRALSQSCAALIAWELAVGSSPQLPENDKLTVSKEAG